MVCSNLANHFPTSMASMIVLSYNSKSPGELSHKWKNDNQPQLATRVFHWFSPSTSSRQRVRRYTLTALIIASLQSLGSMSPTLQRLMIHIIQPVVFGGILLLGLLMKDHPLSFLGAGVLVVLVLFYVIRSIKQDQLEREMETNVPEKSDSEFQMPMLRKTPHIIQPQAVDNLESIRDICESKEENRVANVSSPRGRSVSYSSECGDDHQQESDMSRRRNLSTSSEELYFASLRRRRGESIESTSSSLPDRLRGSSFDFPVRGEVIWSESPHQTEDYHDLDSLEVLSSSSGSHSSQENIIIIPTHLS